jgi:FtsZ-interacting cell division protein ZipA
MGTLAAIAGIALAALLTASFGARSSGPPANLKPAVEASTTKAADPPKAAAKNTLRPHDRRRHRKPRQHPPASPAQGPTSLADAQQPPTIKQAVQRPQQTTQPQQNLTTPAPAPQPVRPLSRPTRPKKVSSGGGTFDDSG